MGNRTALRERDLGRDGIAGIAASGVAGAISTGIAQDATRPAVDANRRFYDALWSMSEVFPPQRFNTWPLLSALAASAPARLEIGPGLRPRLPLADTFFVDISRPALSCLKTRGGFAMLGEITALPFPDCSFDLVCGAELIDVAHVDELLLVCKRGDRNTCTVAAQDLGKNSQEATDMAEKYAV
jgi:hypothetical protein